MSKEGKEYRARREANDCGNRFGNFPSSTSSRAVLPSSRMGTPKDFIFDAKASMSLSVAFT